MVNGANPTISSSGGGTTKAFNEIGFSIKNDRNLLFKPLTSLYINDTKKPIYNQHTINDEKCYTGSVFKVDVNEKYKDKYNIKRVYHILGKDWSQYKASDRTKQEQDTQKLVETYYTNILEDVKDDLASNNSIKRAIIHLPQIPGYLYEGRLTHIGLTNSINNFISKYNGKLKGKKISIIADMESPQL